MRWGLALYPIYYKGCIPKRQRGGIYKSINISHVLSTFSQSLTTERKVIPCLSRHTILLRTVVPRHQLQFS